MGDGPYGDLVTQLAESGLALRGGFAFCGGADAPAGPSGKPARALVLIGNIGGAMWPHFSQWLEGQGQGRSHPLDEWTRQTVGPIAATAGARAVFPSDKPYHPFQRWAMRAEGLKPSPMGILMHPDYGPWHAYRAALLFDAEVSIHLPHEVIHPCDQCVGRPCLNTCPVGAYTANGFDVDGCAAHLGAPDLEARPHGGCSARNACPTGSAYRYGPAQQAFHKAAFLRARLQPAGRQAAD